MDVRDGNEDDQEGNHHAYAEGKFPHRFHCRSLECAFIGLVLSSELRKELFFHAIDLLAEPPAWWYGPRWRCLATVGHAMALVHHDDTELMATTDWAIAGTLLDVDGNPLDLSNATLQWTLIGPKFYRAALVTLSGPAAEDRFCLYTRDQRAELWCGPVWQTDLLNAMHHLDGSGGGPIAPVKREAEKLVRRHWEAIERVAEALIDLGELTGDEIEALIGLSVVR